MVDSNGSIAVASQAIRRESFDGRPMYQGTREALVTAGVVPTGAVFPGDRPGLRGPRFRDADGHTWKITQSQRRRGEFCVEWYLLPAEDERRRQAWRTAREEARKANCERQLEIASLKMSLKDEPNDAGQAREKFLGTVTWAVHRLSDALELMDADGRAEIERLIGSIVDAAHSATIYFDPSKRRAMQRRLTDLRAAQARADRGFQDMIGKTLSGETAE